MEKFTLTDATPEDQKNFAEGLDEVLNKYALAISLVIQKKPIGVKLENGKTESGFIDSPVLIIQKKVEKVEVEVVKQDETNTTS